MYRNSRDLEQIPDLEEECVKACSRSRDAGSKVGPTLRCSRVALGLIP